MEDCNKIKDAKLVEPDPFIEKKINIHYFREFSLPLQKQTI
jgi:hypothetical protein